MPLNRLAYVLLAACTGSVRPGVELEVRTVEDQATEAVACFLPVNGLWRIQLTRTSGDCAPELRLEMRAAGDAHATFADCVGYGSYQVSDGSCVLTYDAQCDADRVIGWAAWDDGWVGVASLSRSVYADAVLGDGSCSGLYAVEDSSE